MNLLISNVPTWFTKDELLRYMHNKIGWENIRCYPIFRRDIVTSPSQSSPKFKVRLPTQLVSKLLEYGFFPGQILDKKLERHNPNPTTTVPQSVK